MLRRPLKDWDMEYEIQDSTNDLEQKFYKHFIEFMNDIRLDIFEYQIIMNPIKFRMEIRIRMKKLNTCFAREFSLGMLEDCNGRRGIAAFNFICEEMLYLIKEYAMSLCYKKEDSDGE